MNSLKTDYSKIIKELRIFCTALPASRFWGILVAIIIIILITKVNLQDLVEKGHSSNPALSHKSLTSLAHTPQLTP